MLHIIFCKGKYNNKYYTNGDLAISGRGGEKLASLGRCESGYPLIDLPFGNCFTASMCTMAETTSVTNECHKAVHKWKYCKNYAVGNI